MEDHRKLKKQVDQIFEDIRELTLYDKVKSNYIEEYNELYIKREKQLISNIPENYQISNEN